VVSGKKVIIKEKTKKQGENKEKTDIKVVTKYFKKYTKINFKLKMKRGRKNRWKKYIK
jgi:hypothetical protein